MDLQNLGKTPPVAININELLTPPQRLPLGIPIKIAIIEKIESARGTMGRGKRPLFSLPLPIVLRALSFFSPQLPHNTKRPLRRRENEMQKIILLVLETARIRRRFLSVLSLPLPAQNLRILLSVGRLCYIRTI